MAPERVVLVVDAATDRALVRASLGPAADAVRHFELEATRAATTDGLFRQLVLASR
jgi:hypothetical protein